MTRVNRPLRRLIRSDRIRSSALATGVAQETAKNYLAGTDLAAAIKVMSKLARQGLDASLAYLPATDEESETLDELLSAIGTLGELGRGVELSVKPSSLGIHDDVAAATERLRTLAVAAQATEALVTVEMQGVDAFDDTLSMWRDVRADVEELGITLPVDIIRSEAELPELARSGARVRLCVGSYRVPRGQAHRGERDKSLALVRCLRTAMEQGGYAMVASHDPTIIAIAQELAVRNGISRSGFEFQMLLGVRPLEQRRLVDIGYTCRTYLPYGPAWFEYLTTRIAARPRSVISYLRALADKR